MQVFKFGGASIKNSNAIRQLADLLDNYRKEQLVLVISAMDKTTNELEEVVELYWRGDAGATEKLSKIKAWHFEIVDELFDSSTDLKALVNDLFVEAEWILEDEIHDTYDYLYDQIVAIGELVSTRIIEAMLQQNSFACQWLDARSLIRTDENHREGHVDWEATRNQIDSGIRPILDQKYWVVTQGFIAGTSENVTTTLGREGSDFSAAIIGACLDASQVTAWKNVPGIMTADPAIDPEAEKLERLSYREAIEMTYYGAKVIHPRTIQPLLEKSIPLTVRSFDDLSDPGSLISGLDEEEYPPIKVRLEDQVLLQISTLDFSFISEVHLSDLFSEFASLGVKVELMRNSAVSISVCVQHSSAKLDLLLSSLKDKFKTEVIKPVELLTIRHYDNDTLVKLTTGRSVLLQELNPQTAQVVMMQLK